MNLQVLALIAFVAVAPEPLAGQAVSPAIDSVGISRAIAARLVEVRSSATQSVLTIDSAGNRWNAHVRRALISTNPKLLPALSEKAAFYASHFSVIAMVAGVDTATASVQWLRCYTEKSFAFTGLTWIVTRHDDGWTVRELDYVTTGHGLCDPYRKGGAR
jgi:hypothetical protein